MRNLFKVIIFCSLIVFSCQDDNESEENCGCDGVNVYTIPIDNNLVATIGYKTQLVLGDDYYNDKYWIGYTESDCINCIHTYIVCNDEFISSEIKSELSSGGQIEVKFAGYVKEVCEKKFDTADHSYNRIVLTKIEKVIKTPSKN